MIDVYRVAAGYARDLGVLRELVEGLHSSEHLQSMLSPDEVDY